MMNTPLFTLPTWLSLPWWGYLCLFGVEAFLFWAADLAPRSMERAMRLLSYAPPLVTAFLLTGPAITTLESLILLVIALPFVLSVSLVWGVVDGRVTSESKEHRRRTNDASADPADSAYVQSLASAKSQPYSISFVEFDARGDYWVPEQHECAWQRAAKLAEDHSMRLVIYCHGWQNSAQSEDVVRFADFLGRLAEADRKSRVHGIYLAWCGTVYQPKINQNSGAFTRTAKAFGKPLVRTPDREHPKALWGAQRIMTYHGRKLCAEADICGVPMAHTIFRAAREVRAASKRSSRDAEVVVIGHSFGALMLEKSLGLACVSGLTAGSGSVGNGDRPLPFDLVLFVNSAAPSLYAKMLKDFLKDHRKKVEDINTAPPDPLVVSLTSQTDCATGVYHPIGNIMAHWSGNLKRRDADPATSPPAAYYKRTPGHNPWLLDYKIELTAGPQSNGQKVRLPLKERLLGWLCEKLSATGSASDKDTLELKSLIEPQDYFIAKPLGNAPGARESRYWVLRCGRELIKDHGDVWSENALRLYSALFRYSTEAHRPATTRKED
jgi:hypothetical protein